MQCSICKIFKLEKDFPIDNNVVSNKKRSNCKACEVKRHQNYLKDMSPIKKEKKDTGKIIEEKRVIELKSNFLSKYLYFTLATLILLLVVIFYFVSR